MAEKKEELLVVNDLLVQFEAKCKKINAVNNVNLEVYRGETFAVVGESGSGKTTLGRAIIGVQPIKKGTVYLDNQIVIGKATNLYELNKEIHKNLKEMELNSRSSSNVFQKYVEDGKVAYFKLVENKKYIPGTKRVTPYQNVDHRIRPETDLRETGLISEERDAKLAFIMAKQESVLRYLISIIRLQQKALRFIKKLDKYSEDISRELYNAVFTKLKRTHVLVRDIKQKANNIYNLIGDIDELRSYVKSGQITSIKDFFTEFFKIFDRLAIVQSEFVQEIQAITVNQKQNIALSAPLKRRRRYIKKYNALINLPRQTTWKNLQKYRETILQYKSTNDERFSQSDLDFINNEIKNFWGFSTINFKAIKNFFTTIYTAQKNNVALDINKLQNIISRFKASDVESEIKTYFESDVVHGKIDYSEIAKLKKRSDTALEIVKKDIVTNRDLVNMCYKYSGKPFPLSDEEAAEYQELLEFLKLPSINQIASEMELLKKPTHKIKKNNKREMQMIFQDPSASLNDRMAVEQIIAEGIDNFPAIYKTEETRTAYLTHYNSNLKNGEKPLVLDDVKDNDVKRFLILNMVKEVGLLAEHLSRYPHEFSGGQRQRIGIARSLIMKPKFIIADEPISALDVSIRAQIMNLLKKFQQELGISYIFVAHDLSVVRFISDRIGVIYRGDLVEVAPAEELFTNPLHPYTKSLLSAIPLPDPEQERAKIHYEYNPAVEHADYLVDYPNFTEVLPDHYVLANQREVTAILENTKN